MRVSAYYCLGDKPWSEREWIKVKVSGVGKGLYQAVIPLAAAVQGAYWVALASDSRPVTVSSMIEQVPNLK
ncbi:MAG TPA: hypothetical protein VGO56_05985 [Pyrinomonadaceae bacterium]|nr:hypothetical protein [Pyrinomonadaceae bacterium]